MSPLHPILIADDEPTDQLIWKLAFERAALNHPLTFVSNGQEVLDYLAAHGPPRMLLLDLKMPRLDGFDVLTFLATNREFRRLPVYVFSSSSHDDDMQKARNLGARDYFVKPHSLDEWVKILHNLQSQWPAPPPGLV